MRHPFLSLLSLCGALLLAAGCDSASDSLPSIDEVPPERLMAFTAVYAETLADGSPIQRIVIADRLNPEVFEVVSAQHAISVQPILSPDKRYVLFGDVLKGAASAPRLVLYDRHTGQADTLVHRWPDGTVSNPFVAPTYPLVWERDSRGFYYTNPPQPFSRKQDVLRYRLDGLTSERVRDAGEYSTFVIGVKDADTLVVITSEPSLLVNPEERPVHVALMTQDGKVQKRVHNEDLAYISESGQWKQQFLNPIWDPVLRRVLTPWFSREQVTSSTDRPNITVLVSDIYERTSKRFVLDTSRIYLSPTWVEGVGIVVEAASYGETDWRTHRLLVISSETGAVRPFADLHSTEPPVCVCLMQETEAREFYNPRPIT